MRQAGIQGAKRRGKPWRTTVSDPNATRPADLVCRDFTASRPDELWVCDFERMRCWDGVLFLVFVIDVYSRRVVGWQLATHMRDTLVIDALRMALSQRQPGVDVALVVHSDAGSHPVPQLRLHPAPHRRLRRRVGGIGRRCLRQRPGRDHDRPVEDREDPPRRAWKTLADVELATLEWVDWFNNARLHSACGRLSPTQFEQQYLQALQTQ